MKTSQPVNPSPFGTAAAAAAVALIAGLLIAALWLGQPAPINAAVLQYQPATVDLTIPGITITAKRMSQAEKASAADAESHPAAPHLTVIGYRGRTLATLARAL